MSMKGTVKYIEKQMKAEKTLDSSPSTKQLIIDRGMLFSCRGLHFNDIRYAIEVMGADVNTTASTTGALHSIPLYMSRKVPENMDERLKCMQLLIEHGADIERRDGEGDTVLAVALKKGALDIVMYLLDHGAETKNIDKEGNNLVEIVSIHCLDNAPMIDELKARTDLACMFMDSWIELYGN